MSLIKKADVQNYLSARRRRSMFPFEPASRPEGSHEAQTRTPKPHQGHDRELSPVTGSIPATENYGSGRSAYTSTARKPQV